jgi:predicted permease
MSARLPWLIRIALRAFPRAFRQAHAAEMEEDFAEARSQAGTSLARLRLTLATAGDLVASGLRERRAADAGAVNMALAGRMRGVTLDVKLGLRLLVKYPGLTLVGTLAMAFAILVCAISFEFFTQVINPRLPLADANSIAGIVMVDAAEGREKRPALQDFLTWRASLESLRELGAFRTRKLNLIVGNRAAQPVEVADISAAAFRVAQVPAFMGRHLLEEDEQPGAPAVVVIGYDIWRTRFDSDPEVVGREVRLGNVPHTVAGVMPKGFAFPISQSIWVPFNTAALNPEQLQSGPVYVFGRLAPGASLKSAQAELTLLGERAAADSPETHQYVTPRILPYVAAMLGSFMNSFRLGLTTVNLLVLSLLFLICGNVALLTLARAATRESELVVRSALGASRGRLTGQLFVEALLLAGIAAVIGLAAAQSGWGWAFDVATGEIMDNALAPFWYHRTLSPETVLYTVLLTFLAAAVAGLLPGLKVTRGLAARLRQAAPGGGGLKLGGMWTVLKVTQVAVLSVVPVFLFIISGEARAIRTIDVGFAAEKYITAALALDAVPGFSLDRFSAALAELERRLEEEPGVRVTFADRLPLMYHPHRRIEVDDGPVAAFEGDFGYRRVSSARIALDFLDVVDAPVLMGRALHSGDLQSGAHTVIVNESFVHVVFGGHHPIGRRFRYLYFEELGGPRSNNEPWYEIVGVVRDMGMSRGWDQPAPKKAVIYHPLAPASAYPLRIALTGPGDPLQYAARLRTVATAVDPTLQLSEIARLDQTNAADLRVYSLFFWLIFAFTGVVLLLSMVGIYAVLSFAASQRTREVGIRVALGGQPLRIALAMFRRPLLQVGLGILIGLVLAVGVSSKDVRYVVVYGPVILLVCSLAAAGPVRRALRVEPAEALRGD